MTAQTLKFSTYACATVCFLMTTPVMAEQSVPTCQSLRASSVHLSRPDIVRMAYPNATYVGQGREAEAMVRSGQLDCGAAALDRNGNIIYRPG